MGRKYERLTWKNECWYYRIPNGNNKLESCRTKSLREAIKLRNEFDKKYYVPKLLGEEIPKKRRVVTLYDAVE